jgi:hypothetical protein
LIDLGQQVPGPLEEVAVAGGHAHELAGLADHDDRGHAEQEPDQGRLGQEVGHKPQPGQSGRDQDDPGDDGQGG